MTPDPRPRAVRRFDIPRKFVHIPLMSSDHATARAAIELALIGVTPLCVADILCR
ncbi:hypothetical protein GCM10010330_40680 [Streptomyces tendae]|nr:hypothetical protein GCM10010330_40680 [Streptomyces tendae]